jgi:glutamine synthetase
MTEAERLSALEGEGVRIVRVTYPDLHGVLRGKDVPIRVFAEHVVPDGLGFCKAISTVDLQHNVVSGFEHGFRDIHVWPLPDTLVRLPWAPEVAWCLAEQTADGEPYAADPRATLKRAMAAFGELDPSSSSTCSSAVRRRRGAGRATSRTRRTCTRSATTPTRAASSTACCLRSSTPSSA